MNIESSSLRASVAWLLVICAWAAIYLPALGTRELQGEEARRVLPGRTMIQTGDWIVPRSAGRIYNRKPPMVNWAAAAAIKITGRMDEWTVRLPSVLGILALAMCVLGLGKAFLGVEGAFFAAIVCLTNIGFIEKGRLIEIEALYISLSGIALMLWLHFWWREMPAAAWLTSLPVLGLGFLTKGPVHVWYFYAIVIAILLAEARAALADGSRQDHRRPLWRSLLHWSHLLGLALFFASFLPWALTNAARNPQKDSGAVWSEQITHRLGFGEFDLTSWLLQIPQSLVNFLPWALLLPLAWKTDIVARWDSMGRRGVWTRALRNGLVIAFLVIAVLPSSRPRFMLPLNVAGAMLLAMLVAQAISDGYQARVVTIARATARIMWLALAVNLAAATVITFVRPPTTSAFVMQLIVLIIGALLLWRATHLLKDQAWFTGVACHAIWIVAAGVSVLAFHASGPAIANDRLQPFAAQIRSHTGPDAEVILFRTQERMWPFYLGLRCREIAFQKELPAQATWVMTPEKDRAENLAILEPRYGKPVTERALTEPETGDAGGKGTAYVLFEFAAVPGARLGVAR